MSTHSHLVRPVLMTLLAALVATVSGVADDPDNNAAADTQRSPEPLIIFVDADRDVAGLGRLSEVAEHFQSHGYDAVLFDPWQQTDDSRVLASWIRNAVRRQGRRVMVVGWSYGAVVGLEALDQLAREGISVDTFVEIDCFFLTRHVGTGRQARNARRIVVIRSGLNSTPEHYVRPVFYRLSTNRHLSVPTLRYTQRVLFSEAGRLRSPPDASPSSDESAADRVTGTNDASDPKTRTSGKAKPSHRQ